ncbi:hypothetical protein CLAIMM_10221 [Cladophialophora immunda]|nr:hypothetical protein CLAIMM_10221 [Cladophialophora immunda]
MDSAVSEKRPDIEAITPASPVEVGSKFGSVDEAEVFVTGQDGVNFRTVGWIRASMFFLKMTFAAGVLSIPAALYNLGAVAGAIFIVFWGALNTYCAVLQGQFKLRYPSVHTVADSAHIAALEMGFTKKNAWVVKEITEFVYLFTWILSRNLQCHIWLCCYIIVASVASIRKIHNLGWITWVGFISIVTAIMIVVIAVTVRDRPAAAPQTGDFDLGFAALPPAGTTFATAWSASLAIFSSSANTSGFVPVISEMRRPQDYFKSVYVCMAWITSSYLALATTVYAYCGRWVASPALGSAGPTIKIISYAIAIPGLIAGTMICVHVAGKSIFVRILRNTHHLTQNTKTHWAVWLSCTYGTGLLGWILCEAIPFYGSLVSLIGALGFGYLGVCIPAVLWFVLNEGARKRSATMMVLWYAHIGIFVLGLLITVGGTYANVVSIIDQYRTGQVGSAFSCVDNSNTVAGG